MLAIELRPAETTYRVMRMQRIRRWSVALVVAVCPLILILIIDWLQRADQRERADEKSRVEVQLAAMRERFRYASAEAEQLLAQIQRADALRSKRSWSDLLALVGGALPQGGWLTQISTEPPQPVADQARAAVVATAQPPAPASPAAKAPITIESPRELRVSGYAVTAAEPSDFVAGLRSTNLFAKVELIQCRQEPVHDGSYYRFDVVCKW